ncbi:D-alanine--D-alanine ligase family protein [Halothermothrix orenii]|uniref:D-alanine--D-alanine ligase n=1 Tax=Halothermothrix orenii (strain H 168 / OCM 544 / DSM 9562) TaxID=373903 RepID=DDL_HALOH|nr:D-alanine--D-alanine ligase [Halothermothrix orenii]B8CWI5.1 RecName: Full=D-alanine--D-alanine ligase; AltName: Full=D-Ala-D-Ala ligase; AltName: Full=D-alanylalanine synthetase [Halothermothrix orenii H 168]ACL69654.1 D-alanine--D-alanine ligase [Halothermothrix orenii H 168]
MSKLRLGVLFGGRSQEHEVSVMSARSVVKMAKKEKYKVIPFGITKKGQWVGPEESWNILNNGINEVKASKDRCITESVRVFLDHKLDIVFPVLHGPYGEDGKLQGFLDCLDIPYIGASVLSSAAGMDKEIMKNLFSYHKIPQARYRVYRQNHLENGLDGIISEIDRFLGWPCFVKPANMGSSIGVSKVHSPGEVKKALEKGFYYDRKLIFEEFVEGREIECSVLGNDQVEASLPGEILPGKEFYDYEAKYKDNKTRLVIPASLDESVIDKARNLAIKAFKAIDGNGFARVDFFLKNNGVLLVNEINTIPGFTQYSMYPKLWEATGLNYPDLIDKLIELALEDR